MAGTYFSLGMGENIHTTEWKKDKAKLIASTVYIFLNATTEKLAISAPNLPVILLSL